jgi:hypothetical protein
MTSDMSDPDRRPYAASANVIAVLNRARTRNLPDKINNDFLKIAQIGDAVFGRVMFALEFLGLISPDGIPTDKLRAMASAPEADFRELLAATIREAYADEFTRIDPGADTQAQVQDAFRRYQPKSQVDRMVMLFLGLCREAGIPVRDVPRDRKMQAIPAVRKPTLFKRQVHEPGAGGPKTKTESAPVPTGLLFGFTQADVASLSQAEFDEVWKALGKVARARAKAQTSATSPPPTSDDADGE